MRDFVVNLQDVTGMLADVD